MHVGAEESEESTHSSDLNLSVIGGIEVLPSLIEIFVKVVISGLTFETKMSLEDFRGSGESSDMVEVELAGWLILFISRFHSVLGDHGVHELIITRHWSLEVFWNSSIVFTESFISKEIVVVGLETWMWVFSIPLSGNTAN